MTESAPQAPRLCTSTGEFPLYEYRLRASGREWSVLHTGAVLSLAEEADYLHEMADRLPYGVALWPAALALAHEVAARAGEFRGKKVLELGAGTGLPGIVAASVGAAFRRTGDWQRCRAAPGRPRRRLHGARAACRTVRQRAVDERARPGRRSSSS